MTRSTTITASLALLAALATGNPTACGQSPWLPPRWELTVNPSYTFETFDEYHFGNSKEDVSFGDVDHHRFLVGLDFGVWDDIALDLTTGYVRTLSSRSEVNDGWADTTFGARYRVIDEFSEKIPAYVPTITARLGGIIEGSYFTDNLEAPGKGASGFEPSLLLGKAFGDSGFRAFGDVGYQVLAHDIPDTFFGGFGFAQDIVDTVEVSLSYHHIQSLSGPDVDEPRFRRHEFPERKEIVNTLELDLGIQLDEVSGREFRVRLGKTLWGRNTGSKLLLGFSLLWPF